MKPPFRADQVGSLLRPERLKQAREKFLGPQTPTSNIGPHHDPRLKEVEAECVHYYMGGKINRDVYKDDDAFWHDLIGAYKQEIRSLVDAGAKYIQLDDTSIAFICDPAHRDYVRSWGMDPEQLLHLYADQV